MSVRHYLAVVLDGMAKGLFASLIIGVILKQIGVYAGLNPLVVIGQTAQFLMGPCIGAGIAVALGTRPFTLLAAMTAGALGAGTIGFGDAGPLIRVGEPVGALVASWIAIEIGKQLDGKTKFDLLLVPAVMLLTGGLAGMLISPQIALALKQLGQGINELTLLQPLPMGILLSVCVGMLLTLPISSAALCIAIGMEDIAAGAALAGCCAQMVGFAAISWRDNKWGGILALGLGTSMLQIPNIIKNPWIWLPPTVASALCGPVATLVFHMRTDAVGAGMGTSGLVGQVTTLAVMGQAALFPMLVLHFLMPILISVAVAALLRQRGLIRPGDLTI